MNLACRRKSTLPSSITSCGDMALAKRTSPPIRMATQYNEECDALCRKIETTPLLQSRTENLEDAQVQEVVESGTESSSQAYRQQRRQYTLAERLYYVREHVASKRSINDSAHAFGIPSTCLQRWLQSGISCLNEVVTGRAAATRLNYKARMTLHPTCTSATLCTATSPYQSRTRRASCATRTKRVQKHG